MKTATARIGAARLAIDFELIRSLVLWTLMLLITGTLAILLFLVALTRMQNLVHMVNTVWGRVLNACSGARVQIHNREHLYRDGPIIILANHQSMFDIPVLYAALDVQFRWMAKAPLFKIPVIGHAMKWAGYIPVERDNRKLALQSLFQAAEIIRGGRSVIIFPEGTFGREDGSMLPFKKGAFILAKKAGVVIQPVTLKGSREIAPYVEGNTIQRIYGGDVDAHIHAPLLPEDYADMSPDQISDTVRERIQSAL